MTRNAKRNPKPPPEPVMCQSPHCLKLAQVKVSGFPVCETHVLEALSYHHHASITPIAGAPDAQRIMGVFMLGLR